MKKATVTYLNKKKQPMSFTRGAYILRYKDGYQEMGKLLIMLMSMFRMLCLPSSSLYAAFASAVKSASINGNILVAKKQGDCYGLVLES